MQTGQVRILKTESEAVARNAAEGNVPIYHELAIYYSFLAIRSAFLYFAASVAASSV
jgi:hypothetical protein